MVTASGSSEKKSYLLVTFVHGDPSDPDLELYTDQTQDVEGHLSTPTMEVDIPENVGTFDAKEAKLLMPVDAFTSDVGGGLPHSPVYLKVEEVIQGLFAGHSGSRKTLFRGRITRTIKNYQGRNDTVAFFSEPVKSRLDVPMGLQCNHHCENALFSAGCGLNRAVHIQLGEITAIDGKEVTISASLAVTNPSAPGGDNSRFWERGYLEKDGLRISVHIWSIADPNTFVLRRRPPNSWLSAGASSITFVPGCHKTIEDCRGVWDNEQGQAGVGGFLGLGYSMLPYNPLFQNPQ